MAIVILKNGILDTVQDGGRVGYRSLGFGPSGPVDPTAFMIANTLVGNQFDVAALEFSFPSPILEFTEDAVISVCGADFAPSVNGKEIDNWSPIQIRKGDRLSFKKNRFGRFAYLAVSGGIDSEKVLGSSSTNPKVPIGDRCGRPLRKGEILETGRCTVAVSGKASAGYSLRPKYSTAPTIRALKGSEFGCLGLDDVADFEEMDFIVTNSSDRMGYRLSGDCKADRNSSDMISSAVTFGTVQLPPDGNPIVLMADHQTTGGYPRIAQIIATDLPLIAQLQPGMRLGFKIVAVEHAVDLLAERNRDLKMLELACLNKLVRI